MCQFILELDDDVLAKAKAVAETKNATLTKLVQRFLESLASRASNPAQPATERLQATFAKFSRDMGTRRWTRESLYER